MKLVTAFLRLIRWPNLVFIVVTQCLFYYCIILPFNRIGGVFFFDNRSLVCLILSSVLIAAAGYIINDYFDLNIDRVNKPEKLVVEKIIKRRWAIVWHILLSVTGVLLSVYVDLKERTLWVGFANLLCVLLLFGYSASLKKKFLVGNVLISLLTAWVIIVVFLCYYFNSYYHQFGDYQNLYSYINRLIKLSFVYSGFAFIISLIREVIKDMEDMEGDEKYGCKTMPIVWGIPASKVFTAVWLIVLTGAVIILQFYALHLHWWWSVIYSVVTIIIPLLWILRKLYTAQVAKDYHQLSTAVKLVMLAGILSMVFFKIYS
ncbi:geranylgeranylglycerol-phosphate geranylgeranyltransferase [Ferruginibacter sp. SUN106]|uniref:geranylgeranylglycerol-phosphate geranylgeranyltransferase n=1 Tax=Ferruginibacter sp. SUN106 TaxID=2978348 RepID=UPI003D35BAEF